MRRFPTESILVKASFDPFGAFANTFSSNSSNSPTMERPDQVERKVSFNPEAAAFSPITTAAEQAENITQGAGSAECHSSGFGMSAVPHGMSLESPGQRSVSNKPEDSPLASIKKTRTVETGEASASDPDRLQLQDLLDKGIPMEALMRSLEGENLINQEKTIADRNRSPRESSSQHDLSTAP